MPQYSHCTNCKFNLKLTNSIYCYAVRPSSKNHPTFINEHHIAICKLKGLKSIEATRAQWDLNVDNQPGKYTFTGDWDD